MTRKAIHNYLWLGDVVHDVAEPRHWGKIKRINWSTTATVRWLDTGWLSEVRLSKLKRVLVDGKPVRA